MFLSKTEKGSSEKETRKNRATEVVNLCEELISTFALVLLFITFVMQTFVIPTGSMADTLKGAHFRLRCLQCGYRYDHDFRPRDYGLTSNTVPRGGITTPPFRCPSCGYYQPPDQIMRVTKGDRILVLKCIYRFFEPKRWDVIVFKAPFDPSEKYIKRLIGLPGETVEIIDGDVYIDGQISRKPVKVQNELWMPVYDNDYQPVRPRMGSFNGHFWEQPFKNVAASKWEVDKNNPTRFCLNSPADQVNVMIYDSSIGNDFRATYAYDDVRNYRHMPYCSDLMVCFYARSADRQGRIGIEVSKYQNRYSAWVDFAGDMVIAKASKGQEFAELARKSIEPPVADEPIAVSFANVDHQLIFQFGTEKLTHELGRAPQDAGERETDFQPQVKIFGSGKLTLSHTAIFRDIYYTTRQSANNSKSGRAAEGNPLSLGMDEFFVLGDNSPISGDSRWWDGPGKGDRGRTYREGTVPRDYLVGKALFVFWSDGFKPFAGFPFAIIPNVGQMRFIYGGSNREL